MHIFDLRKKSASVLILSLWTVSFLAIIAANIGLGIRQRAMLLSRIEDKSKLHYLSEAGVKKAISLIRINYAQSGIAYSIETKETLHNNPLLFKEVPLGEGLYQVFYPDSGQGFSRQYKQYGVVDEERKININTANKAILQRLVEQTVTSDVKQAEEIANSIIDWRDFGESEAEGFYSDNYYASLKDPYPAKKGDFEVLEELLLVKNITKEVYAKLLPYITIYTDGKININTVSKEVLVALGVDYVLADKIINSRRGKDGLEATGDDHIFSRTFDIASELHGLSELNRDEFKLIDHLNSTGVLKINSSVYFIESVSTLENKSREYRISCIYNLAENRVEHWREK